MSRVTRSEKRKAEEEAQARAKVLKIEETEPQETETETPEWRLCKVPTDSWDTTVYNTYPMAKDEGQCLSAVNACVGDMSNRVCGNVEYNITVPIDAWMPGSLKRIEDAMPFGFRGDGGKLYEYKMWYYRYPGQEPKMYPFFNSYCPELARRGYTHVNIVVAFGVQDPWHIRMAE